MNRNNDYNKTKIASVSTGKAVVDIYADCFAIEKVKLVISEYEGNKASIDTYIKFADFLRITEQVRNKDIFAKIKKSGGKGVDLYRGGTPAARAKRQDGKAIAKILTMNMSETGTIFLNASRGPGKESGKGALIPDGASENRISVSMTYEDCYALFNYTELAIKTYLPRLFGGIFAEVDRRMAEAS